MSRSSDREQNYVLELLAGRALGDLTESEHEELDSLMHDDLMTDASELEHAAASAELALHVEHSVTLPERLRKRLVADAEQVFDDRRRSAVRPTAPTTESIDHRGTTIGRREWIAWTALAASLLVTVGVWLTGTPTAIKPMDLAAARGALIGGADDVIRVDWADGKTPFDSDVVGDVVWSTQQQKGFMRFVGMPINDPSVEQYQLWIIDPQRDEEPIDGGVFDVTDSGELIVPIDAKLAVIDPAAFAITIEQPGGVVVSTQDRLPLLASVN